MISVSYHCVVIYGYIFLKFGLSHLAMYTMLEKICGVRDGFLFHVSLMQKHIFKNKNKKSKRCIMSRYIFFMIYKLDVMILEMIYSFDPISGDHFTLYFIKIGYDLIDWGTFEVETFFGKNVCFSRENIRVYWACYFCGTESEYQINVILYANYISIAGKSLSHKSLTPHQISWSEITYILTNDITIFFKYIRKSENSLIFY